MNSKESGLILVHVVCALTALLAMGGLVVDQGAWYVARGQSQNAADAGALAGATALAYDSPDLSPDGAAYQNAVVFTQAHAIFGRVPRVRVYTAPPTNPQAASWSPFCTIGSCVQVDVQQNVPVFFMGMFGITSQFVQATATAQATDGPLGTKVIRLIK